ncbi:hypothetical protein BHE74_00021666 [Ensete ventricosum]|nr:hypothetical protein BHE74_00021666 [Ensete ventricosum]
MVSLPSAFHRLTTLTANGVTFSAVRDPYLLPLILGQVSQLTGFCLFMTWTPGDRRISATGCTRSPAAYSLQSSIKLYASPYTEQTKHPAVLRPGLITAVDCSIIRSYSCGSRPTFRKVPEPSDGDERARLRRKRPPPQERAKLVLDDYVLMFMQNPCGGWDWAREVRPTRRGLVSRTAPTTCVPDRATTARGAATITPVIAEL